ncbi:hemagglutinin [Ralstonia pickettii]|uniref:Hemagglutinin n=1 Tax=Ralstonia pickettii TaxID=329 RepID=A0A7X2HNK5_RALPI|nr:hemagglutinin [Ralstonia pickettii]
MRFRNRRPAVALGLAIIMAACLAACGGGDDSPANSTTSEGATGTTTPVKPKNDFQRACTDCAATDDVTYSGSGVGIWSVGNTGTTAKAAQVNITMAGDLSGQDIRVVHTNPTDSPVPFSIFVKAPAMHRAATRSVQLPRATEGEIRARIQEFNRSGFAKLLGPRASESQMGIAGVRTQAPTVYAVNDQRQWNDMNGVARTATLVKQQTAADGKMINLWVEHTELAPDRINQAIVDQMLDTYARAGGVYDMLTTVGGPLWGDQPYNNLLAPNQPIDLVLLNFDHNAKPFGMVGYFHGLNSFLQSSAPKSNESVSLYLDTETMYLGGSFGLQASLMTLAHEGMHMQNFYRRAVLKGSAFAFDTWLEEQSAMMMEDWASFNVNATFNNVRDVRIPDFVATTAYTCPLTTFTSGGDNPCDSYSVNGSFGGFLNRQLGLSFYKDLLTREDSADSKTLLDNAIRAARADSSFSAEAERFAVTMASLMPSSGGASRYSFPARAEGGFQLPAVNLKPLQAIQSLPTSPATLAAHAAFVSPRVSVMGAYTDTVTVPPGTNAWVVIQPKE